jgi:dolichyl-phosphate beta-glucosyltransferase
MIETPPVTRVSPGQPPDLSLIIPAYNEEQRVGPSLEAVCEFMSSCPHSMEVVVVDDGSRDQTAQIVSEFSRRDPRIRLLHYPVNRGKGYAVSQGLREAKGQFLVFSDTDLSAPIDQMLLLITALEKGADLAIASRRLPQSEVIGLPWARHLMGCFFALLSRWLVLPGISDTQCGFKAYQSEAARQLVERQKIDGYTFDVEHLYLARQLGLKVVEVPVRWIFSEGSQINGLRDSIRMFRDLLVIPKLHR